MNSNKNYSSDAKLNFLGRYPDLAQLAFGKVAHKDTNLFQPKDRRQSRRWQEIEEAKMRLIYYARIELGYSPKTVSADIVSSLYIAWRRAG